jgi:general secretion pathway protein K
VADLAWLGLSPASVQAIKPFVVVLPGRTPVNLNTAPPEVLMASVPGLDMARAQSLVQARAAKPMATLMDAGKLVDNPTIRFDKDEHDVNSRFFSVTGLLRIGQATVQEQSVLQRDGMDVKTISRTHEVLAAGTAPLQ